MLVTILTAPRDWSTYRKHPSCTEPSESDQMTADGLTGTQALSGSRI